MHAPASHPPRAARADVCLVYGLAAVTEVLSLVREYARSLKSVTWQSKSIGKKLAFPAEWPRAGNWFLDLDTWSTVPPRQEASTRAFTVQRVVSQLSPISHNL